MKKLTLSLFLGCTSLLLGSAPAAFSGTFTNAEDVLQFALAKNSTYTSFSSHFVQTVLMGPTVKMDGNIQYKRPSSLRIDITIPVSAMMKNLVTVIGPDNVMWQEMAVGGQTNVMKLDFRQIPTNHPAASAMKNPMDTVDPRRQLELAREKYDLRLLSENSWRGQPMYVLEGLPKAVPSQNPMEAAVAKMMGKQLVYISPDDGMIHHLEQYDSNNSNVLMSVEFSNFKINPELPDSLFVYRPAPNATIIDLVQKLMQASPSSFPKPDAPPVAAPR